MQKIIAIKLSLTMLLSLGIIFSNFKLDNNLQQSNQAFLYQLDFKHHKKRPDLTKTDYILVNRKGNITFTQYYNQMKADSIETYRKLTGQERYEFMVNDFPYTIKTIGDKITFTARVADQYFQYDERLDFKWKITKTTRKIGTYNCELATVNYAGRTWNAWFTKNIPVDIGPYKFKGLPGCIVEISDTDGIFKYSLVRYVDKKIVRLEHYPSVTKEAFEKTTRKAFNKHQQAYLSLGFEQRMAYLRRRQADPSNVKLVTNNDGINLKNKSLDDMEVYNFIEIDHIE